MIRITKIISLFSIILWFCGTQTVLTQDSSAVRQLPRVGVFGGTRFNIYSGLFEVFDGNALCGTFTRGDGFGFAVKGLYEHPLTSSILLGAAVGFTDLSGTFKTSVRLASVILPDGELKDAYADHTLDATLSCLVFQPAILWYPLPTLPLHLQTGPSIGLILKKQFSQREVLTAPLNATFLDGTQDHIVGSGDIASASSIRLSIDAGAAYDVRLGRSVMLTPSLQYSYPLTKVARDADWRISALTGGLALKYVILPPERIPPPPPPPPPVERRKISPPVAVLGKEGTAKDGEKKTVDEIVTEELRITERRPLLPYIFFDQGDAVRPLRQKLLGAGETTDFSIFRITGNELELYPHILNIIGERMRSNPKASITLTGTNNGFESEKSNAALSLQRAETIKRYLVDGWVIDPKRITVQARNLPADASAPDTPEGREENRRVEISSADRDILTPVSRDERQYSQSFSSIDFLPRVTAEAGLAAWDFSVRQENRILYQASGTGEEIPAVMRWDLNNRPIAASDQPVSIDLNLQDRLGQSTLYTDRIPVRALTIERKREERIGDMLVSRSGLIVFDFDKATLSDRNRRIIEEIRAAITPQSRIQIIGYTDALGDADHNLRLSLARAQAVREAIGTGVGDDRILVEGRGSRQLLYPNDTPEGRFYCRMVQIVIETPVK